MEPLLARLVGAEPKLRHTPGGKDHDQDKHGNRGGGGNPERVEAFLDQLGRRRSGLIETSEGHSVKVNLSTKYDREITGRVISRYLDLADQYEFENVPPLALGDQGLIQALEDSGHFRFTEARDLVERIQSQGHSLALTRSSQNLAVGLNDELMTPGGVEFSSSYFTLPFVGEMDAAGQAEYVVTHEFAHALEHERWFQGGIGLKRADTKIFQEYLNKAGGLPMSDYGWSNTRELYAEAFAISHYDQDPDGLLKPILAREKFQP